MKTVSRCLNVLLIVALLCGSAWAQLGPKGIDALIGSGQYREARDALIQVLEGNPNSAKAHYAFAVVLERLKDIPSARLHLERALDLEPAATFAAPDTLRTLAARLGVALRMPGDRREAPLVIRPEQEVLEAQIRAREDMQLELFRRAVPVVLGVGLLALVGTGLIFIAGAVRSRRQSAANRVTGLEQGHAFLEELGALVSARTGTRGEALSDAEVDQLLGVAHKLKIAMSDLEAGGDPNVFRERTLPNLRGFARGILNPPPHSPARDGSSGSRAAFKPSAPSPVTASSPDSASTDLAMLALIVANAVQVHPDPSPPSSFVSDSGSGSGSSETASSDASIFTDTGSLSGW